MKSMENTSMQVPNKIPTMRTIAMPADTNPRGDIFGGWLLSQMDLAGSTLALEIAKNRVVTVAIDAMTFLKPVFVGDEISCYTEVISIGNTSVTVKVEAWVRRIERGECEKVTEGDFTYVAVNASREPLSIEK